MTNLIPRNHEAQLIFQLVFAMALGWLIGWERKHWKKPAGGRTFMLISLGSCLFTIISIEGARAFAGSASIDPLRIASNVLTGIGFIGAGLILHHEERVEGVTSAAAMWVAAAVGMSVALNFFTLATVTALLTVGGLNLSYATRKFFSKVAHNEHVENEET